METIHLEQGQEFGVSQYLICETGDYLPTDLVQVYRRDDEAKIPWVAYQAYFVAFGTLYEPPEEN